MKKNTDRKEHVNDQAIFDDARKAAEAGDVEAMAVMGVCYFKGTVKWSRKAAELGDPI